MTGDGLSPTFRRKQMAAGLEFILAMGEHRVRTKPAITDAVRQLLAPLPAPVQSLAIAARSLLLASLPDAVEIPDTKAKMLGYGYGQGYKDMVATLILSKKGVKLGLVQSASFPDPARLLKGVGKVHRHIVIRVAEDLRQAEVRQLIERALGAWRERSHEAE